MVSNKIMKTAEFKDAVFYRLACNCTDREHDTDVIMEYDSDIKMISLIFYKKFYISEDYYNSRFSFIRSIFDRLKIAFNILIKGYYELEDEILINDVNHIDGFIEALKYGRKLLEDKNES